MKTIHIKAEPLTGDAYVELSGYVDPEPIEWLRR